MKSFIAALFALTLGFAAPLQAAESEPRYSMQETEDGFLRLDRETGQVSHCRMKSGSYVCESVADERSFYEEKIAELEDELDRVRGALGRAKGELPTDEDIASAFSAFESFAKHFSRAMRVFKDEMNQVDEPLPEEESSI
ncbi:hypothetical protein ACSHT0_07750 [Tepidicaulis sp. LMO-SS28]|uniref:hypothetical protein n=1 Tax=Tepidicaulis sp. LMO-SS28 TaxID=3447455 RepID=UPI003EDEF055